VAGALQSSGHHALVLRASAGAALGQNFCVGRHKAAQGLRIFIVYRADFVATEVAIFFDNRLVISLLWSHITSLKVKV